MTGAKNPMYGKNHSDESKQIMSDTKKGKTLSFGAMKLKQKYRMLKKVTQDPSGSGRPSQVIEVTDIKTNDTTTYDSISAAARALNINKRRISDYFTHNQTKAYKGQYTFKKV